MLKDHPSGAKRRVTFVEKRTEDERGEGTKQAIDQLVTKAQEDAKKESRWSWHRKSEDDQWNGAKGGEKKQGETGEERDRGVAEGDEESKQSESREGRAHTTRRPWQNKKGKGEGKAKGKGKSKRKGKGKAKSWGR